MTTTQIQAWTTVQVASLATSDLNSLTTTQFVAFTTNQINDLTTTQWAGLRTADIAVLTTAQIAALTTAEIAAFTTAQIVALSTGSMAAFTTQQIHAFETADIAAMSTTQLNALVSMTPIVLDLDGNGIQTIGAAHGVQFDLGATGVSHQVGWVGGKDGLLVMDRNGDGIINDGRELFGAATVLASGQRAGNGYNAMANEDTNHDGKLNKHDANFDKLKVWVDANHDGKTDAGELKGLVDMGIVELDLSHVTGTKVDNGNLQGLVSSYTTADGKHHEMADVWFAKAQAAPPALGDLLAAPSADLMPDPGAPAAGTTAKNDAVSSHGAHQAHIAQLKANLDDELRRDLLI